MDNEGLTPKEFFNYVTTPVDDEITKLYYKAHNITLEKTELYNQFILSLFDITFNTFLGDELINTREKMVEHFKWCWDKNQLNFEKEGVILKDTTELKDYFKEFMLESYYVLDKRPTHDVETKITWFWNKCFKYRGERTHSELDILGEVYNIFEKSLQ
tara:strand:- start:17829 stop:18302 length:474 start_codon:yes stop_codon:yes gene_type:complete